MTGIQRGAYQAYRVLIGAVAAACIVQIFLAGRGVFGIRGATKLDDQSSLDPHRMLGEIIGIAAILCFLLALAAWKDRRLIGETFALALMAEVLQHAFALPKHPWIAGLHALDGVAILGLAGMLAARAWRTGSEPAASAAVDSAGG